MIKLFEKVIKEHLAKYLAEDNFPLSYLKFSTVTSGSGLNDKVIFLVFKNHASLPFLCLKTVRNYEAKQAILRHFHNLKKLNVLTAESSYARLFAQALYLHDDGKNIFCIETACLGERIKLNKERLKIVLADYLGFQEYLAKRDNSPMRDIKQLAEETAIKSGLNELDRHKLLEYITQKPPTSIKLPRIIQHGDFTLDNLLWSKNGLCIIDYDYVGNSDIPGFDLFGLLHRFDQADLSSLCKKYFPEYFKKIGGESLDDNYRGLLLLYHMTEYAQSKPHNSEDISFAQIISDFEQLYPLTLFS
ncbi:MAG: phosphotransferase [Candidatus Zambryskibacteria bacterium]|nr:phosphotransferase [Candidatus Zambryskibacteria bacterium]